jgi:hypothetical protein
MKNNEKNWHFKTIMKNNAFLIYGWRFVRVSSCLPNRILEVEHEKLISKKLHQKHTKHCVLDKAFLNLLGIAKWYVASPMLDPKYHYLAHERPSPCASEASGVWQKNNHRVESTGVQLLYTVGQDSRQVYRFSLTLGGSARATYAIWLPNLKTQTLGKTPRILPQIRDNLY